MRRRTASMQASSRRPAWTDPSASDIAAASLPIGRSRARHGVRSRRDGSTGDRRRADGGRTTVRTPVALPSRGWRRQDGGGDRRARSCRRRRGDPAGPQQLAREGRQRPVVLELEHADEYPRQLVEQMREFGLFGATIPVEYGGLGLGRVGVRAGGRDDLACVDVADRSPQLAPDDGRAGAPLRHRGPAHPVPAGVRGRRPAGRAGAHRARLRVGPAGRAHRGAPHGDGLCDHGEQDLDHQRRRGQLPGRAGQDRPGGAAPPRRHVAVHREAGRRLPGRPTAEQARLQRRRHRRAAYSTRSPWPPTS